MALPHVLCALEAAALTAASQSVMAVLQASLAVIGVWPEQAVEIVVQAAGGMARSDWSDSRQVVSAA
jgi:hypothetical protein